MARVNNSFIIAIVCFFTIILVTGCEDNKEKEQKQYECVENAVITSYPTDVPLEDDFVINANLYYLKEVILNSFPKDSDGNIIYPDYFSGIWIEDNKCILTLLNINQENIEYFNSIAGTYVDLLEIRKGELSYNLLIKQAENIVELLKKEIKPLAINYYISDNLSSITIGITADGFEIVEDIYKSIDIETSVPVQFKKINTGETC